MPDLTLILRLRLEVIMNTTPYTMLISEQKVQECDASKAD